MPNLIHSHAQWGADDQIGAANLLTVEKRLAALASVRQGRIYDAGSFDTRFMLLRTG